LFPITQAQQEFTLEA